MGPDETLIIEDEFTTCKKCNRSVRKEHVNAAGNCVVCEPAVRPATEEEWRDLGRPPEEKA